LSQKQALLLAVQSFSIVYVVHSSSAPACTKGKMVNNATHHIFVSLSHLRCLINKFGKEGGVCENRLRASRLDELQVFSHTQPVPTLCLNQLRVGLWEKNVQHEQTELIEQV
jgi:hypothetical protein